MNNNGKLMMLREFATAKVLIYNNSDALLGCEIEYKNDGKISKKILESSLAEKEI